MRATIESFLKQKAMESGKLDLSSSLIFSSYGGSHLAGTNGVQSDIDVRAVNLLSDDYLIGINSFEHDKLTSGKNGITHQGDLDVEVYHCFPFIHRLMNGETNTVEMAFAPKEKIIFVEDIFQPVLDNLDLFVSKNLIHHYRGLIFRHLNQAQSSPDKVKKEERRQRILTYSYDTKEVMKAIMYLRIGIEFLRTGILRFHRTEDFKELIQFKNGAFLTFEEANKYIQELLVIFNRELQTSKLPKTYNHDAVNHFVKEYHLTVFKQLGIVA